MVATLEVKSFAHIQKASIAFGDLTLLVGAQGTGKSLLLQWLKTAIDGKQVVHELQNAGQDTTPKNLIDLIFGDGMGQSWDPRRSVVTYEGRKIHPTTIGRRGNGNERLFFIPAHRASLVSDGWAAPFQKLSVDFPVVARLFSQNLYNRFTGQRREALFPLDRVLKKPYRNLIDRAVFHSGQVSLERTRNARRLQLEYGRTKLPFMTWTAGQREFAPLLLGLYHLLPPRKGRKIESVDWVVIEEPEMGLHPQAITAFMMLVLDLLWRGYRVVISTHSPLVLTCVWMLRRLAELQPGLGNAWRFACDGLGILPSERGQVRDVAAEALRKRHKTYLLKFEEAVVVSKDISSLDPGNEDDDVSGWGGLSGFASNFSDAVRRAVVEAGK